jgi:hypothetical protein
MVNTVQKVLSDQNVYKFWYTGPNPTWIVAESIEWFIEDQAFSRSYDLASPHPPLSRK